MPLNNTKQWDAHSQRGMWTTHYTLPLCLFFHDSWNTRSQVKYAACRICYARFPMSGPGCWVIAFLKMARIPKKKTRRTLVFFFTSSHSRHFLSFFVPVYSGPRHVDSCEPPVGVGSSNSSGWEKQDLVELHNESSTHKTGGKPMAALREQLHRASLLLMCSGSTAMSHHTSPGSLHTLLHFFFFFLLVLWVRTLHPCSVSDFNSKQQRWRTTLLPVCFFYWLNCF